MSACSSARHLVRAMALPAFRRAARITAVSRFLADDIRRLLPALEAEVQVTPMPVDVCLVQRTAGLPANFRRGFSSLEIWCRAREWTCCCAAGAELQRRGVPFELKILGEGPLKPQLQALADAARASPAE